MNQLKPAVLMLLAHAWSPGVAYPLLVTGIAQLSSRPRPTGA